MGFLNKGKAQFEHSLLVGGTQLTSNFKVRSIVVFKEINLISGAIIYLSDGNPSKQEFKLSDTDDFKPGTEIEIQLGPVDKKETVFKGIIIKQGIQHRRNGSPMLMIELKHPAVRMTQTRKNAHSEELSDKEILESLAPTGASISADDSLSVTHPEILQYNTSDWDFMVARAEVNGCFVYTNDGETIEVKKPEINEGDAGDPIIYGSNVYEFEAEVDARSQLKSVEANSWDYIKQTTVSGIAETVDGITEAGSMSASDLADILGDGEYRLFHSGYTTGETEMENWAKAKLMKSRLSKIRGSVQVDGDSGIQPGDTITLEGMGQLYNGSVFVSGVRHEYDMKGWYTTIQFGVSPEWFVEEKDVVDIPVSGFIPPLGGLQIGKVTDIAEDPAGQFRVKVNLQILGDEAITVWARVARPDAGAERGFFVQPRIDDEVVVGFINQDPRDAIVLGALHAADNLAPPFDVTDDYYKTGIKTEAGNSIEFDDEKNIITVTTAGGNSLVIDDDEGQIVITDGSNTNSITMNSDGITLDSSGDIILKTGSGDISLEGMNITHSAQAQFTAEGNGGAELSTTANAVIKGSLVQIN